MWGKKKDWEPVLARQCSRREHYSLGLSPCLRKEVWKLLQSLE
jgi:hypothetical protein